MSEYCITPDWELGDKLRYAMGMLHGAYNTGRRHILTGSLHAMTRTQESRKLLVQCVASMLNEQNILNGYVHTNNCTSIIALADDTRIRLNQARIAITNELEPTEAFINRLRDAGNAAMSRSTSIEDLIQATYANGSLATLSWTSTMTRKQVGQLLTTAGVNLDYQRR